MKIHLFGDFDGNEYELTDENTIFGGVSLRRRCAGSRSVDFGRLDTIKALMFEGRACDVVGNALEMLGANFDDKELPLVAAFVNGK